jgi:toxin ParE1/3/4
MKVQWSPLAVTRLEDIVDYIALDSPETARRWAERILEAVGTLKDAPKMGRKVPEIERNDIRELILGNYRIIYRVGVSMISILTVRHGKQLLPDEELEE